jgi:hypothetical protein
MHQQNNMKKPRQRSHCKRQLEKSKYENHYKGERFSGLIKIAFAKRDRTVEIIISRPQSTKSAPTLETGVDLFAVQGPRVRAVPDAVLPAVQGRQSGAAAAAERVPAARGRRLRRHAPGAGGAPAGRVRRRQRPSAAAAAAAPTLLLGAAEDCVPGGAALVPEGGGAIGGGGGRHPRRGTRSRISHPHRHLVCAEELQRTVEKF